MFNAFITALFVALPFFESYANALVLRRDVFDPPITYPTAGTVWHVGEEHNVTWDTSVLPANFNQTGMIVLGFLNDTANDGNEHLDLDHPLATGFPLAAGRADVTVPAVPPMDSYILVLFGDSGNASPQFKITNISIGMPPSSSPSIPPATTSASSSAPASASASSSASSPVVGSSSTEEASLPASTLSSVPFPASNTAASNSPTTPSSRPSIAPLAASSSSPTPGSTVPSSSGASPSASAGGSENGITATSSAQRNSIPFTVLSLSAAIAVLSWIL